MPKTHNNCSFGLLTIFRRSTAGDHRSPLRLQRGSGGVSGFDRLGQCPKRVLIARLGLLTIFRRMNRPQVPYSLNGVLWCYGARPPGANAQTHTLPALFTMIFRRRQRRPQAPYRLTTGFWVVFQGRSSTALARANAQTHINCPFGLLTIFRE